jgi:hypothetical protein
MSPDMKTHGISNSRSAGATWKERTRWVIPSHQIGSTTNEKIDSVEKQGQMNADAISRSQASSSARARTKIARRCAIIPIDCSPIRHAASLAVATIHRDLIQPSLNTRSGSCLPFGICFSGQFHIQNFGCIHENRSRDATSTFAFLPRELFMRGSISTTRLTRSLRAPSSFQ